MSIQQEHLTMYDHYFLSFDQFQTKVYLGDFVIRSTDVQFTTINFIFTNL